MKKIALVSAAFGAAAFVGGAAMAGDDWEAKLEEKFNAIDANGDGSVSEAEYLAAKTADAREHYAKVSGGDGSLTLDEAKAAYKEKKKKHKKKMKEKHGDKG